MHEEWYEILIVAFSVFKLQITLIQSAGSYASPSTWIHSNTTLWCILKGLHAAGYKSA